MRGPLLYIYRLEMLTLTSALYAPSILERSTDQETEKDNKSRYSRTDVDLYKRCRLAANMPVKGKKTGRRRTRGRYFFKDSTEKSVSAATFATNFDGHRKTQTFISQYTIQIDQKHPDNQDEGVSSLSFSPILLVGDLKFLHPSPFQKHKPCKSNDLCWTQFMIWKNNKYRPNMIAFTTAVMTCYATNIAAC